MKKYVWILISIVILISGLLTVGVLYRNHYQIVRDSTVKLNLVYKGFDGARDFTVDDKGNIFIAYDKKVQYIDKNGKSYDLFKDSKLKINSIVYGNNGIYIASQDEILSYNMEDKEMKVIISGLPNFGDYKKSKIAYNNGKLYISVGSATNSGVVGSDNLWLKEYPFNHDISPFEFILSGKNFGSEKTGAFTTFGSKNSKGQVVPGHLPGNSCLLEVDLATGKYNTFAWGIRNIEGIDFESDGSIVASVGGFEPRGLRPVTGDTDYIFKIEKGKWYGWPDFSGGDPVTSPKFKGDGKNKLDFIMNSHPDSMPPAPLYQHTSASVLKSLAVDKSAVFGRKDSIYFYDFKDNILYELNKNKILSKVIEFNGKCSIISLKSTSNGLLMLDEKDGTLYSLSSSIGRTKVGKYSTILFYAISIIVIIIVKILWDNNSFRK